MIRVVEALKLRIDIENGSLLTYGCPLAKLMEFQRTITAIDQILTDRGDSTIQQLYTGSGFRNLCRKAFALNGLKPPNAGWIEPFLLCRWEDGDPVPGVLREWNTPLSSDAAIGSEIGGFLTLSLMITPEHSEFSLIELECADGVFRRFEQLPLRQKFEFDDRLKAALAIMTASPAPIDWLYLDNQHFRLHCDRCFELHGIELDWVCLPMVQPLLFRVGSQAGWLIELNRMTQGNAETVQQHREAGEDQSAEAIIAAIACYSKDPGSAYALATTVPYASVLRTLAKLAEYHKSPEEREKTRFNDWAARTRKHQQALRKQLLQQQQGTSP